MPKVEVRFENSKVGIFRDEGEGKLGFLGMKGNKEVRVFRDEGEEALRLSISTLREVVSSGFEWRDVASRGQRKGNF